MTTGGHLIDDVGGAHDARAQMTADEALLDAAAAGAPPTLRLYTWARPSLSLGRFQSAEDVDQGACERRGVEVVRRPSGGRALLHGADLTYAIALVRPDEPVRATYCHLARGLIEGLTLLGVEATVTDGSGSADAACFSGAQGADLRVGSRKLCGSAMVRRGRAVLQHGALLLERLATDESEVLRGVDRAALRAATVTMAELGAPADPDVVASALVEGFAAALDLDLQLRSSVSLPRRACGRTLRG